MRFYLCSAFDRNAEMTAYQRLIEETGHKVTSRWHSGDQIGKTDIQEDADKLSPDNDYTVGWALKNLEDLDSADCLVYFSSLAQPGLPFGRGGRHREAGYCLARAKGMCIIGPRETIFDSLIQDSQVFETFPDFLFAIKGIPVDHIEGDLVDEPYELPQNPNIKRVFDLKKFQAEQLEWANYNFPGQEPWVPLLGAVEEIGELAHAHIKAHQGIRVNENHDAIGRDAIGDVFVYLAHYCSERGWDMEACIQETWERVMKRDWQKNRVDGKTGDDLDDPGPFVSGENTQPIRGTEMVDGPSVR